MPLAADRAAEDHRGTLGFERARRIAVVVERRLGAGDRPLLGDVDLVGDARGQRQMPASRIPRPVTDPAADLRVRLLGGLWIGVVVQARIPAVRLDVGDAVAARRDVLPEGSDVGRVGEDAPEPDDGHRVSAACIVHVVDPLSCRHLCLNLTALGRTGRPRPDPCRREGLPGRCGCRESEARSRAPRQPAPRPRRSASACPPRPP